MTTPNLGEVLAGLRPVVPDGGLVYVLGIAGGDGTNHVTITGFLEVWEDEPLPPLAFLRGGTFNTVANAVGVPRGRPDGILARLIRKLSS